MHFEKPSLLLVALVLLSLASGCAAIASRTTTKSYEYRDSKGGDHVGVSMTGSWPNNKAETISAADLDKAKKAERNDANPGR